MLHMPDTSRRIARLIRLLPQDDAQHLVLEPIDFRELDVGEESGGGEISSELSLPRPRLSATELTKPSLPPETFNSVGRESRSAVSAISADDFTRRYKIMGSAGIGTSSSTPAIDRLSREILVHLEERPTLVVWLMDQSASLIPQRAEIQHRLDRIYRELGAVQASGSVRPHEDEPLLSSVIAFGSDISLRLKEPTSDMTKLRNAVAGIKRDDSGVERVFSAVVFAANQFSKFRRVKRGSVEPIRNVMFIVMTDEAGDDQELLEQAVQACAKTAIPVYVIGVPAPFGQSETLVKWVEPDPAYDQRPTWGLVNQGPETAIAERIRIGAELDPKHEVPIDSGFGPYGLTRLAYETGGIYFAVHADRDRQRAATEGEVQAYSSHLKVFFDSDRMARYRPDYQPLATYEKSLRENEVRSALVQAATSSYIQPLEDPRVKFTVRSDSQFAAELTEAQKSAAVRAPRLQELARIMTRAEHARDLETEPRWQAGFDLAIGQVLSELVRNQTYNAMLAKAKRGLQFRDPRNNTWTLVPAKEVLVDSELQRLSEKAHDFLLRVAADHAGTPWAFVAEKQLQVSVGWRWSDSYVMPPEERERRESERRQRMPKDDQIRRIPKKPTRERPRL